MTLYKHEAGENLYVWTTSKLRGPTTVEAVISQFKLGSVKGKSWPHPVIVDGKLFIRDQESLLCYDLRQ